MHLTYIFNRLLNQFAAEKYTLNCGAGNLFQSFTDLLKKDILPKSFFCGLHLIPCLLCVSTLCGNQLPRMVKFAGYSTK